MYINEQTLIRLPVFTKSGEKLGHVIDIEFDIDNHVIRKYFVGARFQKEVYLIAPSQVIEITADKILVEDGVLKDPEVADIKKQILPRGLDAALPRTSDN